MSAGPAHKVGDEVSWESQAGGMYKRKAGKIVAIVMSKQSVAAALPNVAESRIRGQDRSLIDRYVVQVYRKRSTEADYYTPSVGVVDARNPRAGSK